MILPDVNVLLYAFRRDAERHDEYHAWLETVVNGDAAYGVSPQVLAALVRISTHRQIYRHPSTTSEALAFCEAPVQPEHCQIVQPGPRHWLIFSELCRRAFASGSSHVQLAVIEGNEAAEQLYERLGFRRFARLRTLLFS